VVGLAAQMFLGHSSNGNRIENSGRGHEGSLGEIQGPWFEVLLQPSGDRHGKAGFFSMENGFRQVPP
jgi:hypothetical protein